MQHGNVPIIGQREYALGSQRITFGTLTPSQAAQLQASHVEATHGQVDVTFALVWMCASEHVEKQDATIGQLQERIDQLEHEVKALSARFGTPKVEARVTEMSEPTATGSAPCEGPCSPEGATPEGATESPDTVLGSGMVE